MPKFRQSARMYSSGISDRSPLWAGTGKGRQPSRFAFRWEPFPGPKEISNRASQMRMSSRSRAGIFRHAWAEEPTARGARYRGVDASDTLRFGLKNIEIARSHGADVSGQRAFSSNSPTGIRTP